MLEFYLLRHGQTAFNVDEHVQGFNDSPLTQKGLYQARCAGYGLKDTVFDQAYSGMCPRQVITAQTFLAENDHPLKVTPDIHFNEMNYGKYQAGTYFDMLDPLYKDLRLPYANYEGLLEHYDHIRIAELLCLKDETRETEGPYRCAQRFLRGLKRLTEENKTGKILIASSSLVIAASIHELFPDIDMHKLPDNASVSVLAFDGTFYLIDYNNTEYRRIGEEHFRLDV